MMTRREARSLLLVVSQTSRRMNWWVSTLPTFLARRQSSLYSMGVRCSSRPARDAVPVAKSTWSPPLSKASAGAGSSAAWWERRRSVVLMRARSSPTEKGLVR